MYPLYVVDAFTLQHNEPFTGNQAAICIIDYDNDISDETKQKIAAEMNLSETAFVSRRWTKDQTNDCSNCIRWFTPTNEVDLCGHATLAAANVLFDRMSQDLKSKDGETEIKLATKFKGVVGATINWTKNVVSINFPLNSPVSWKLDEYPWLEHIIKLVLGENVSTTCVEDIQYSADAKKLLVRLQEDGNAIPPRGPELLHRVQPEFEKLVQINTDNFIRGVIVTTKGKGTPHFYSRYFSPWNGINEDPVTGSAHTVLAPYWRNSFQGENTLLGRQCSERCGDVYCTIDGDRVKLSGTAKIIVKGELLYE